MKSRLSSFIRLVLGIGFACALLLPQGNAQAKPQPADECNRYDFAPIGYSASKTLGHTVTSEFVPESIVTTDSGVWLAHPCLEKHQFSGYPYPSEFGLGPTIYFYPLKDSYAYLNPADPIDHWSGEVEALRAALKDRPMWQPPTWGNGVQLTSAPLLPFVNAATIYLARQKYVKFPAGEGISYLGQVSQEADPPNQNDTFFIFQGITHKDEYGLQYYISAIFPVFLSSPPAPVGGTDPFAENQSVGNALAAAKSTDFNLDLTILDDLVGSFMIYPGMPMADGGDGGPGLPVSGAASFVSLTLPLGTIALVLLLVGSMLSVRTWHNPIRK